MESKLRAAMLELVSAAFDYADEVCERMPTCQKCYARGKNCRQRIVADQLFAKGLRAQNWIPVSSPPEEDGKYIVCGPTLPSVVKKFAKKPKFCRGENVWYEYNSLTKMFESINNSVTHWMPIPEKASTDDFVEFWHQNETGMSLRGFLGMTPEAYAEWLKRGGGV